MDSLTRFFLECSKNLTKELDDKLEIEQTIRTTVHQSVHLAQYNESLFEMIEISDKGN